MDQNLIERKVFVANEAIFYPWQAIEQIKSIFVCYMQDSDVKFSSHYDFGKEKRLIGDANRVQQVLLNLVSNARKFVSQIGGRIQINAGLSQNAG